MEATEEETGHADTLLEEFPDTEVEESTEAVEEPQAGSDLAELIAREEESAGAIETKGESAQAKVIDESHGFSTPTSRRCSTRRLTKRSGKKTGLPLPEKREAKAKDTGFSIRLAENAEKTTSTGAGAENGKKELRLETRATAKTEAPPTVAPEKPVAPASSVPAKTDAKPERGALRERAASPPAAALKFRELNREAGEEKEH